MRETNFTILAIIGAMVLSITLSLGSTFLVLYFNAGKDWIGALIGASGNIIGGILGGYIAFFVSRHQIQESKKNDDLKEKHEAINLSLILKEEIRNNSLSLDGIINGGTVDASVIKHDLTREAWLFFSSKVAHKMDESLFISLNTIYRKTQIYQVMPIEEIQNDVDMDQIRRLKFQLDDCVRKLEDFRRSLNN